MKSLLDEQLSKDIARELRSRGLDVETVSERPGLAGRSDEEVMEAAAAEARAVITNNIKDYRPIAARRLAEGRRHGGLILVPATRSRSRAAIGPLAEAIEAIMLAHPTGIEDSEHWIAPFA